MYPDQIFRDIPTRLSVQYFFVHFSFTERYIVLLCESIFRATTGCMNIESRHDTGAVSLKMPWLKDHRDKLLSCLKYMPHCSYSL